VFQPRFVQRCCLAQPDVIVAEAGPQRESDEGLRFLRQIADQPLLGDMKGCPIVVWQPHGDCCSQENAEYDDLQKVRRRLQT
jgi:hypothetical protein